MSAVKSGTPGRLARIWGEIVGPESSALETVVVLGTALAGTAWSLRRPEAGSLPPFRRIVLAALALDLWGGVAANNTRSCARWYERPGQGTAEHLRFALAHGHPFVLAWCDGPATAESGRRWRRAAAQYAVIQLGTLGIRWAIPMRRRLAGVLATTAAMTLDRSLGRSRVAPWFGPVLYAKLLLGHASATLWTDAALETGQKS